MRRVKLAQKKSLVPSPLGVAFQLDFVVEGAEPSPELVAPHPSDSLYALCAMPTVLSLHYSFRITCPVQMINPAAAAAAATDGRRKVVGVAMQN